MSYVQPASAAALLRVRTLVRTAYPAGAAATASLNLLAVVSEWPAGSALELTIGPARRRGSVAVTLRHRGVEHPAWRKDVEWAFSRIASLAVARPVGEPPMHTVLNVRPALESWWRRPINEDDVTEPWQADDRPANGTVTATRPHTLAVPWPTAMLDDASELARVVAASAGLFYRVHLAPASEVEREMVRDAVGHTWHGSAGEASAYAERSIRLRCMLASTDDAIPSAARAVVRRWADHLEFTEASDPSGAWTARPADLVGSAVPVGLALALLRVPAAGDVPVPGLRTELPPARSVPLDPVPAKPSVPIRLGAARTAAGATTSAVLAPEDLLNHMFVLGMTGTGKSTLLVALAVELLSHGIGFTLIDPHGSTATAIAREMPAEVASQLRVVRCGDAQHPVPFDLFGGDRDQQQRAIAAVVNYVQERYDPDHAGMVSARWHTWFSLGAEGTLALLGPRASLVAVVLMMISQERVARLARALRNSHPELSGRIRREIAEVSGKEATELFSWAASKLHPIVASDRLRAILGTGVDGVDLGAVMRARQGLVIDLASMELGRDGAQLLGTLWVQKHLEALGRDASPNRPHVLIVDEAHLFEHGGLPTLLAEGRKWGIGVVAATQEAARLSRTLSGALDANTGSFVALRTGIREAPAASARLDGWPPSDLVRLPKLHAAASLSRDGVPTEPFSLDLDYWRRSARRGPEEAARAAQVDLVEAVTRSEAWAPHAMTDVITEEEIDERLAEATPRPAARELTLPSPRLDDPEYPAEFVRARAALSAALTAGDDL